MMNGNTLFLIILLMICHWLADFTHLSTAYMLKAKSKGSPLFPIFLHACVHGFLMMCVLFFFTPTLKSLLFLTSFEIITHFLLDTFKGKLNVWFPTLQDSTNPFHWYIFGVDQFCHQLVILLIVFMV